MLGELFNFFYELFENGSYGAHAPINLLTECGFDFLGNPDYNMSISTYLSWICALISFIFIVVLCCLFVYKIIKLVGNLIR